MKIQNFLISGILALSIITTYNEAHANVSPGHTIAINLALTTASQGHIYKPLNASESNSNNNSTQRNPKTVLALSGAAITALIIGRITSRRKEEEELKNGHKKNK